MNSIYNHMRWGRILPVLLIWLFVPAPIYIWIITEIVFSISRAAPG